MSQLPGEAEEKGFVEFRRKVCAAEVLSAAIKYLFEMIGLYPDSADNDSVTGDSLARTLLLRLGLPGSVPAESANEGREFSKSYPLKSNPSRGDLRSLT